MAEKEFPNVSLGGKIAKEKGDGGDQVHGHEKENTNGRINTNPKTNM